MGTLIDLVGKKFHRLTVTAKAPSGAAGAAWLCVCDCGNMTVANSLKLRNSHTKSCGCLRKERNPNLKHGLSNKSKTYKTWKCMRSRCDSPTSTQYKWYGGRGIKYDTRWNDYTAFVADMGERPDGKTLDRINPDLGYFKENCRWATPKEQAENNRGLFKKGRKKQVESG